MANPIDDELSQIGKALAAAADGESVELTGEEREVLARASVPDTLDAILAHVSIPPREDAMPHIAGAWSDELRGAFQSQSIADGIAEDNSLQSIQSVVSQDDRLSTEERRALLRALPSSEQLPTSSRSTPSQLSNRSRPRAYLASISVEGFRGIGQRADLPLEPQRGLTLIYGANGSGKSTFAEALDVLLTGSTARFAGRGHEWRSAWANAHSPDRGQIDAEFVVEDRDTQHDTVTRDWTAADLSAAANEKDNPLWGAVQTIGGLDVAGAIDEFRPILGYGELGPLFDESGSFDDPDSGYVTPFAQHIRARASIRDGITDALWKLIRHRDHSDALYTELSAWQTCVREMREAVAVAEAETAEARAEARAAEAEATRARATEEAAAEAAAEARAAELDVAAVSRAAAAKIGKKKSRRRRAAVRQAEPEVRARGAEAEADARAAEAKRAGSRTARKARRAEARLAQAEARAKTAEATAKRAVAKVEEAMKKEEESLLRLVLINEATLRSPSDWRWEALVARHTVSVSDESTKTDMLRVARAYLPRFRARLRESIAQSATQKHGGVLNTPNPIHPLASGQEFLAYTPRVGFYAEMLLDEIHSARLEQFSQRVSDFWQKIRRGSDVRFEALSLQQHRPIDEEGKPAPELRVSLGLTIDGDRAIERGALSQGELHSLALSVFLPALMMPGSPFGFAVIDDPVQVMDEHAVDGLAEVLRDAAEELQLIVFTHDSRLLRALNVLNADYTRIDVTRSSGSVVECKTASNPVMDRIKKARIAADHGDDQEWQRQDVALQCRLAIEAACLRVIRASLAGQRSAERVEDTIERATQGTTTTRALMERAIFGSPGQAKRARDRGTYRDTWDDQVETTLDRINGLVHAVFEEEAREAYSGDLHALIDDVEYVISVIEADRG